MRVRRAGLLLWTLLLAAGPVAQGLDVGLGAHDHEAAPTAPPLALPSEAGPANGPPPAPASTDAPPAPAPPSRGLSRAAPGADPHALLTDHAHPDHIVVTTAPNPTPVYGPGGTQDIAFVCAEGNQILGLPLPSATGDDPVVHGCPIRVYDTGYSFGNPSVAVNVNDHSEAAFFSLHGAPTQGGPKDTSRTGLTHVTFTSDSQGLDWQDQPTDYPEGGGGFGDFASGAIDSDGNLYSAFVWNFPRGQNDFDGVLGLYKGPTTREFGGMTDAYDFGAYIDGRDPGNRISTAHAIRLPSFTPPPPPAANQSAQAPTTEDENGEVAAGDAQNATDERIVVLWHEIAADYRNATSGKSAWIDAAWTDTSGHNRWTRLNKTQLIGPCREMSNPAYYEDKIYVLCVVDRGYQERPRARVGDVDVWTIDPYTGNTSVVERTGLTGGRPLLAANEDGYMVAMSYMKDIRDDGTFEDLQINAAFGWYGKNWERLGADLGPTLRRIGGGPNVPLIDADLTALTLTTDEPTAIFVYKEWHDDPQDVTQLPEDPAAIINDRLTDYNKFVFTFNSCNFPIAGAKMELGTAVDSNNADAYSENPAVFNDIQDGLYTVREDGGGELTYFAVNDYGAMQFGAVVVGGTTQVCFVTPPPPVIPPLAAPQALTIASPYATAVGAAVAVPAVAMIAYLLTTKKRVPSYVAAEDR